MVIPFLAAVSIASEPLRVMTYNIRYGLANDGPDRWEVRRPRTIALIKSQAPDVLGLQEALDFQIAEIRKELPKYGTVGVGRDDGKTKGEYSAILYDTTRLQAVKSDTFWYSNSPTVPGSTSWGNRITRICTWVYFRDLKTGRHFWHFNTHLDHESQPSREKSIELLLRRVSERGTTDPVIVTGDFNVGEENPVVGRVTKNGLRDTFRIQNPNEQAVGTFSGFQPDLGHDKIDYVFADSLWKVKEAKIVREKIDGRWPSDHAPVTAILEI